MPTYEYRCPDGHDFEKFVQKISLASSELPCPICGKMAERRISAGAGLVFKGSGFYITDYGKDGKKDQRTNAAAAASSLAEKSGAKSDGGSKMEGGSSEGSKSESSKSESKSESSKTESSKTESSKSESAKSDTSKPAAKADSSPAPKNSGSSDK
jgi:putative FmdB family regulatory protein